MKQLNDDEIEIVVTTKKILNKRLLHTAIQYRKDDINSITQEISVLENQLKLFKHGD